MPHIPHPWGEGKRGAAHRSGIRSGKLFSRTDLRSPDGGCPIALELVSPGRHAATARQKKWRTELRASLTYQAGPAGPVARVLVSNIQERLWLEAESRTEKVSAQAQPRRRAPHTHQPSAPSPLPLRTRNVTPTYDSAARARSPISTLAENNGYTKKWSELGVLRRRRRRSRSCALVMAARSVAASAGAIDALGCASGVSAARSAAPSGRTRPAACARRRGRRSRRSAARRPICR